MEELTKKLTEILDSPEGMDTVRNIASMLTAPKSEPETSSSSLLPFDMSGDEIGMIMTAMSALKNNESDNTTNLLFALKPHLKPERQQKVDMVVKFLKIYKLWPLIKEVGIF